MSQSFCQYTTEQSSCSSKVVEPERVVFSSENSHQLLSLKQPHTHKGSCGHAHVLKGGQRQHLPTNNTTDHQTLFSPDVDEDEESDPSYYTWVLRSSSEASSDISTCPILLSLTMLPTFNEDGWPVSPTGSSMSSWAWPLSVCTKSSVLLLWSTYSHTERFRKPWLHTKRLRAEDKVKV